MSRGWPIVLVAAGAFLVRPAEGAANPAVVPAPRLALHWLWRNALLDQRALLGQVDLIYVGDSIVEQFRRQGKPVWEHYYAGRHALNLGIGGDRTQNVLWRLAHGNLAGLSPKLAIVMIGQNNGGADAGPEIGEGIAAVVRALRARLPATKILVLAIFPRRERPTPERDDFAVANRIAAGLADDRWVFYRDINAVFLRPDGSIRASLMPDFEHPSLLGDRRWAEAIEPEVATLMGDRPVAPMR